MISRVINSKKNKHKFQNIYYNKKICIKYNRLKYRYNYREQLPSLHARSSGHSCSHDD